MMKTILRTTLVSMSLSAAALASEPAKIAQTDKGATLVDAKGMTLYTFAKDAGGKSACNGPCAANWPPLMATDSAGAPAALDGDSDGVAPATDGTSYAQKFSGKRTHRIIKGAGHNLPQEAPQAFAEAVLDVSRY